MTFIFQGAAKGAATPTTAKCEPTILVRASEQRGWLRVSSFHSVLGIRGLPIKDLKPQALGLRSPYLNPEEPTFLGFLIMIFLYKSSKR